MCKRCIVSHSKQKQMHIQTLLSVLYRLFTQNNKVKITAANFNSKEKPYLVSHELLNPCSVSAVIMCYAEDSFHRMRPCLPLFSSYCLWNSHCRK